VDPRTGLILVGSPAITPTDARQLRREIRAGSARRVRRGVATDSERWAGLSFEEKYRDRINAVLATRVQRHVLGFDSAAAFWGYPLHSIGARSVHLLVRPESHARSKNGVTVHRADFDDDDVLEIDDVLVTTPLRTLFDLARSSSFRDAVVALDHALSAQRASPQSLVTLGELGARLERERARRSSGGRGLVKADRAIRFAKPNAANGGESLSRVAISELGFPDPELQVAHVNPRGGFYFTDLEWPEYQVIGELDGRGKYLKPEYLNRMTPGEAVYAEKVREDHLRAENNRVARWGMPDVMRPERLYRILRQVGLPVRVPGRQLLPGRTDAAGIPAAPVRPGN
jgi:hypothetical protein